MSKKNKNGKTKKNRKKNYRLSRKKQPSYEKAKKLSIYKIQKQLADSVYYFIRRSDSDYSLTSSSVAWSAGTQSFSLVDVATRNDFVNLFDSYCILKVRVDFEPDLQMVNQLLGSTAANTFTVPTMYCYRDLDNAVAPASETVAASHQDCIRVPATKKFSMSIVPQIGREVYRSATQTAYETPYKTVFLDSAYDDVPHYGLGFGMSSTQGTATDPNFVYRIRVTYLLAVKRAK